MSRPLDFGVFITPFHPTGQSATVALEYDMERVIALDRLGFDEAWFGEHHSGGYELIACPEVFIAVAAERPKHIRLGTGVVSLPLPPSADGGRPLGAVGPFDPRASDVRYRSGRTAVSHGWASGMREQLLGRAGDAVVKVITEHADELRMERANN